MMQGYVHHRISSTSFRRGIAYLDFSNARIISQERKAISNIQRNPRKERMGMRMCKIPLLNACESLRDVALCNIINFFHK